MKSDEYVHYGCGLTAPDSWANYDASPTLRIQRIPALGPVLARKRVSFPRNVRYGDIVRGLPIARGTCTAIYCSHVLEHLALGDLRAALKNTFSYLKPGGTFRFVLPDLEAMLREYSASPKSQPALEFMEATLLGQRERPRGFGGFLQEWLGNHRHLWMWDYRSLEAELRAAGFATIRRAEFGDAADARFRDVEESGRWSGPVLGMECAA